MGDLKFGSSLFFGPCKVCRALVTMEGCVHGLWVGKTGRGYRKYNAEAVTDCQRRVVLQPGRWAVANNSSSENTSIL